MAIKVPLLGQVSRKALLMGQIRKATEGDATIKSVIFHLKSPACSCGKALPFAQIDGNVLLFFT